MQTLTACTEFSVQAERLDLAFNRLQIIQKYIYQTTELIREQERRLRALGAAGNDTAEDRRYLVMMRQSLEIMERYQKEILDFIQGSSPEGNNEPDKRISQA